MHNSWRGRGARVWREDLPTPGSNSAQSSQQTGGSRSVWATLGSQNTSWQWTCWLKLLGDNFNYLNLKASLQADRNSMSAPKPSRVPAVSKFIGWFRLQGRGVSLSPSTHRTRGLCHKANPVLETLGDCAGKTWAGMRPGTRNCPACPANRRTTRRFSLRTFIFSTAARKWGLSAKHPFYSN